MEKESPATAHQSIFQSATTKRRRTAATPAAAGHSSNNVDAQQPPLDQSSDGLLSIQIADRLLECPICANALSIPVFQCVDGHILCSNCCKRLERKCPTCSRRTGRIRNRAIEDLLESIMVPCSNRSYGCLEELSYSSKNSHESTCAYTPYVCPFRGCDYVGTHAGLSTHMRASHLSSVVSLRFDQVCSFSVGPAEDFIVFREEGAEGKLFFLNKLNQPMSISCIPSGGSGDVERFAYALVVRGKDSSVRFQSLTTRFNNGEKGVGVGSSSTDFIQMPSYLGDSDGCFKLELCIWSKSSPSVDIAGAVVHS